MSDVGDVIDFNKDKITTGDIPVESVCEAAKECDQVLVIGWRGDDFYMDQSSGDLQESVMLIEIAKFCILAGMLSGK